MEAAAKKVQLITERILPAKPHALSQSADRRYRVLGDRDNYYEEWHQQRLQYFTLVSDADRGVLLTRPYYDMREEPPNPTANALARTEKKNFTKMSLSDYKNKQKKSMSPPEPSLERPLTERERPAAPEPKRADDTRKANNTKQGDRPGSKIDKAHGPRDAPDDERSSISHLKDSSNQETGIALDRKKRAAEADGNYRPLKRNRQEGSPTMDERPRTPKDDTPRKKGAHLSQEKTPQQESKLGNSSILTNGRSILKAATSNHLGSPPVSRSRGNSINGQLPGSGGSSKATVGKGDSTSSKATVPPLLSPLHIAFDSSSAKSDKKKGDGEGDHSKPHKSSKLEPPPLSKKHKSPLRIPSLLSPTLPPILEEELSRIKKASPTKGGESSVRTAPNSESPGSGKKTRATEIEVNLEDRFIVTLKYGRKNAKTVQRLLALPPKKGSSRKERSVSTEAPPQARKRPPGPDAAADSISVKRQRTEESSKLNAPSTPSARTGTAMARMGSNHSQAQTPGDANSLTPGAPVSSERPATSHDGSMNPKVQSLRERWQRYMSLGRDLKHERDALLKTKETNGNARGPLAVSDADSKLALVLGVESVAAYMISFRAQADSRNLEKKVQDPNSWQSLFLLLSPLIYQARRNKVILTLCWQLQALCSEELMKCYHTLDPTSYISAILKTDRQRVSAWRQAHETSRNVESSSMRAYIGPWCSVDDAVDMALRILKQLAEEDHINWRPEVVVSSLANGA